MSLKLKLQFVDCHVRQVLGLCLEKQGISSGVLHLLLLLPDLLKVVIERSNQVLVDYPTDPIDDSGNGGLIGGVCCRIRDVLAEPVIRPILSLIDVINQELVDFSFLEFQDLGDLLRDRAFR